MVRSRQLAMLLCCTAVTGYFVYHAVSGRYGFDSRFRLARELDTLQQRLRELDHVRSRLARDVKLLADPHPDPDLVEEIARAELGLARPGDRVLLER